MTARKKPTKTPQRPWDAADDGLLALLTYRRTSPSLIAKVLERTPGAVGMRKKVLGIATPAKCRKCDAPLPKVEGKTGPPFQLCDEHAAHRGRSKQMADAAS